MQRLTDQQMRLVAHDGAVIQHLVEGLADLLLSMPQLANETDEAIVAEYENQTGTCLTDGLRGDYRRAELLARLVDRALVRNMVGG